MKKWMDEGKWRYLVVKGGGRSAKGTRNERERERERK